MAVPGQHRSLAVNHRDEPDRTMNEAPVVRPDYPTGCIRIVGHLPGNRGSLMLEKKDRRRQ